MGPEQRVVPGAYWHGDRLSKKAPPPAPMPRRKGRDSLALLELLAEVLLSPSPSPAVPSLSCQLLPRPARGWEVEMGGKPQRRRAPSPSHQSDSWTEGCKEVGRWHQGVSTREVPGRREKSGCFSGPGSCSSRTMVWVRADSGGAPSILLNWGEGGWGG